MEKQKLKRNIPISIYPPIMFYNKNDVETVFEPSTNQNEYANLYIHIPFCAKKCHFCYFTSFSAGYGLVKKYVDVLCKEIEYISSQSSVKNKKIHSIYFGGGTPTYLSIECLDQLFQAIKSNFHLSEDIEICMEVRPGKEATLEKLKFLKEVGVNRISIGVQSFSDDVLLSNGRNCSVQDVNDLLDILNKLDFNNINIDIMSGMLSETEETWQNTIQRLLNIQPQNLTIYKMQLYENSKLTQYCKENSIQQMPESMELEYTKKFYSAFMENGYQLMSSTYSLSKGNNFIHKYREYRNNGEELIALGLSANGFLNGYVYQKTYDMEAYLNGEFKPTSAYKLSEADDILRGIILGLKSGRVNCKQFQERYKVDPYEYFNKEFKELEELKYVNIGTEEITISYDQIFYIDDLLRIFFMPQRVKDLEKIMLNYKNFNIRRKKNED